MGGDKFVFITNFIILFTILLSVPFISSQSSGGNIDGTNSTSSGTICINLYAPVCGFDNITYSNSCFASRSGVSVKCEQACPCPVPDPSPIKCSDGTENGKCSLTKPKYCKNGLLIDSCQVCGCNVGEKCNTNGSCSIIPIIKKCYDGTPYGECSLSKPLFCNEGSLINKCSICGCPNDNYLCQEDGICKIKEPSYCGDLACNVNSETPGNCPEDCVVMISSFVEGTTEQRAREIFSSYNLTLSVWWSRIVAGTAIGNRHPPSETELKEDNLENEIETKGPISSSLDSSSSVVPDGKAELSMVVLQYGIGNNYNNTNKFSPYGFHSNSIWRTTYDKGGALKLLNNSACFYYQYSLDNSNFAIYLAKPAVVIDGYERKGNVNGVEDIEFVKSPVPIPEDGFLPNLYNPSTSEICLEPNVYNDQQLEGYFKCISGCLFVKEGASETCNIACQHDIYSKEGVPLGRGKCSSTCNVDGEYPLSKEFGGPIDGCSSGGGGFPKEETCCCKSCVAYCSEQFSINIQEASIEPGKSLSSLESGCMQGYTLIEQNGEKHCIKSKESYIKESESSIVKYTQDEAIEKATESTKLEKVNSIESKEQNDKKIYVVDGSKNKRLFFIFPVSVNIKTTIDAETGEIIKINKPWWNFLAQ
ncbi:hypothetical protein COU57_04175 [Candidatus Pacearchaeota archaeon CG10_big_fil_rev_8_21_14_0_10_32_14]|nr:MAG: hypothetical protein COU57_04175 [Candidatus Pacearchaeota archaeon CG10_big_fil_rev_8_21_14_0_10_32_14]